MAVYDALKGIWPLKKRVYSPLNLAKVHIAAQPILLVCEPGCATAVPSWHGSVHNAAHHVDGVVYFYAPAVCEAQAPVSLG